MSPPEPSAARGAWGVVGVVVLLVVALGGLGHLLATRRTRSHAPGALDGPGLHRQRRERGHRPDPKGALVSDDHPRVSRALRRDAPEAELATSATGPTATGPT